MTGTPRHLVWSRYNQLFTSVSHGVLLYNSLSSTFAAIDNETHHALLRMRDNPAAYDFGSDPGLFLQLRLAKVLVEDGEEDALLERIRGKRALSRRPAGTLGLTILPTTACNFDCAYCYERGRGSTTMNDATASRVVDFIRRFGRLRAVSITWLGGEPLLQFDRICSLTRAIEDCGIPISTLAERPKSAPRVHVALITNGYLLTGERILKLDELGIRSVQITLDGTRSTHDLRRRRLGGGGSYERLLENIDRLLSTPWNGDLVIRTNLDRANLHDYVRLRQELARRFPGKRLRFRPGIVKHAAGGHGESACDFDACDRDDLALDLYRCWGCSPRGFYPYAGQAGCTATYQNSFVIGPDGSLYKCWHDVGDRLRVVGSVHDDRVPDGHGPHDSDAGDVFDDPRCQQCFLLPVCDGGCLRDRTKVDARGQPCDTCRHFKRRLPEFLEAYLQRKRERETVAGRPLRVDGRAHAGATRWSDADQDRILGALEERAARRDGDLRKAAVEEIDATVLALEDEGIVLPGPVPSGRRMTIIEHASFLDGIDHRQDLSVDEALLADLDRIERLLAPDPIRSVAASGLSTAAGPR